VPGADTPQGRVVMGKLDTIVMPKIDFNKMGIAAVVDYLTLKSKELDPDHAGVQFTVILPPSTEPQTRASPYEVSITLENVPLGAVLEYVSQQTHLSYSIVGGTVILQKL
jgi:hypothetical protein